MLMDWKFVLHVKTFFHFERKNEAKNLFLDLEILHFAALRSE
jgi:hypothetical protein